LNFSTVFISFVGLFLPFLILSSNKGYKTVNRYLAAYLFFSALYLLGNFYFFYGESLQVISFFLLFHPFFFLIGPLSFFYVRAIVSDNNKLGKLDFLHFVLFILSFVGLLPFMFSDGAYKELVASEMKSETWDLAKYQINKIIPHKADQLICVLQTIFYSVNHWILVLTQHRRWKKGMLKVPQYKLIHKWLLTFSTIYALVAINYFIVVVLIWVYDDKSEFLARANIFLLIASVIFMAVNLSVLAFPEILYGLPQENKEVLEVVEAVEPQLIVGEKLASQLFSDEYVLHIEEVLNEQIRLKKFTDPDYKLIQISAMSSIPIHHFSYYFNTIKDISFSDWKNSLRIDSALELIENESNNGLTLNAIALKCGFTAPSTFIRAFRQFTGKTPSDYMKDVNM
jgi:AraC-like DNA-binding protein